SALDLFRDLNHAYVSRCLSTYSNPSVSLMSAFMDLSVLQKSREILSTVKPTTIQALSRNRYELYIRWFRNHPSVQGGDTLCFNEFLITRAKKDVLDHLLLGESLRRLSKGVDGFPSSGSN